MYLRHDPRSTLTPRSLLAAALLASLLTLILATPALAATQPSAPQTPSTATPRPAPTVVCTVRPLDQGSGNVRVCDVPPGSALELELTLGADDAEGEE